MIFIIKKTMTKDNEYFSTKENDGYKRLQHFNDLKHFFSTIGRTPPTYDFDASGRTTEDKPVSIEIKTRDLNLTEDNKVSGSTFIDDTLLIEARKMADLLLDYTITGAIPLYINFLNNAVIIFNFSKMKEKPCKKFFKAQNYGQKGMELGNRYLLPIKDAYIYRYGEGEQWK